MSHLLWGLRGQTRTPPNVLAEAQHWWPALSPSLLGLFCRPPPSPASPPKALWIPSRSPGGCPLREAYVRIWVRRMDVGKFPMLPSPLKLDGDPLLDELEES